MNRFTRFTSFTVLLLLVACGRSHSRMHVDAASADTSPGDAGAFPGDADLRPDTAVFADSGPPSLAPDNELARALSCDLSIDDALVGAVGLVACDPEVSERGNVSLAMEVWEAGLASRIEENISGVRFSCQQLRCAAFSRTCSEYAGCVATLVTPAACEPRRGTCDGSWTARCDGDGTAMVRVLDCASLGATCDEGRCVRGDCVFGGGSYYALECDENELHLCGDMRVDCGAVTPGGRCDSLAVGGEAPTRWCAPPGAAGAGVYGMPISCEDGVIEFDSFSGRSFRFECVEYGYEGCNERGCAH